LRFRTEERVDAGRAGRTNKEDCDVHRAIH
jgi:hypothetical protein